MKKRFLALFLALAMFLAVLPTAALAADSYSDFDVNTDGVLTKYNGPGGDVSIPSNVKRIENYAFESRTGVTSVTIPTSVTSIGSGAFRGCANLSKVTIPNSVTSLGASVFANCTSLTSVTIPNSVTLVGDGIFFGCTSLTDVTLPIGMKQIGNSMFQGCTSLTSVTLPDTVTGIGLSVFYGCTSLASINIPMGVTSIGREAFRDCTSLTSITIPYSVTMIGSGAFWGCTSLNSVTIPNTVSQLNDNLFDGCVGLTSVTIPISVIEIRPWAFRACASLKDVYYTGTAEQWAKIKIGNDNELLTHAAMHYGSAGPGTQPATPDQPATLPTVEAIPAAGTAVARTQNVLLDGKTVQFQCYAVKDDKGNESNYVKIRDLAQALNGTKAQFNVGWDGKISITSNTAYQTVGGEGTTPYTGDQPYKAVSNTPVSFNGSSVNLTSFQLKDSAGNGYTYYKLRDLGQLLNFNVTWNGSSIVVESDKPYTG